MIKGKVLKGNKKAGNLGYPTLNLKNTENILPGIYAGHVFLKSKRYDAVIYVGNNRKEVLEAHIFDFKANLYGKEVDVQVLDKIRDDKNVTDVLLLKEMIEKDCLDARSILFERK
jgi:riboflavin kinase/FMN adenylyltransferase